MKFLCTGDWHLTDKKSKNRVLFLDSYLEDMMTKIDWIFDTAEEHKCEWILQPGDFFNSFKANDFLKQYMINYLKDKKIKIVTIYGQHDLRFHSSDKRNTPLQVLNSANALDVMGNEQPMIIPADPRTMPIFIYGCSWNEEIPKVADTPGIHILLIHRMIVREKLWEAQTDHTFVNILFRKCQEFNLMVCGDNHQNFAYSDGDRHLVNCGSLMRTSIDQEEHEPYVYIYDTETNKCEGIPIPVSPFAKVINKEIAIKEKENNKMMEAFIEDLKENFDKDQRGLNFSKNLKEHLEDKKIEQDVKYAIEDILEGL